MKIRGLVIAAIVFAVATVAAPARAAVKKKIYLSVITATAQKILPATPDDDVKTDYRFIIQWLAGSYPETFFWRGENGWLPCKITKVTKVNTHSAGGKTTTTYKPSASRTDHTGAVGKGDLVELIPIRGGKFPIPAEIPATATYTLYFKTAGSGWLSVPVKKITHLADKKK